FLLREEPPGHLHLPALQLPGRLGDVARHPGGEDPALSPAQLSYWRFEAPALAVLALVLTALLLRARPHERSVFLNTLWLFLAGLAGQGAAAALAAFGFADAASVTRTLFRIVTAVALIRILGFAFFRLALPLAGRQPPRIIEDFAIIAV